MEVRRRVPICVSLLLQRLGLRRIAGELWLAS